MVSTRPRSPSFPDRTTNHRYILYVVSVLLMSSLGTMVDLVIHPEISIFDEEHLIVGGITALVMILFIGALETHLAQRKRIEGALGESEERHRTLFESSSDALMTLEAPSWAFTTGNQATIKMFGARSVEDFITHAPGDLSPERQPDGRASAEKAKEMIEKAIREGSHLFEWTHKRIDGDEFPATVLLTRLEIAGKRVLQATVRDITELKRKEEDLARLLRHNERILSSAAEGILGLDLQGRHTFVNPAAARMLGYEAEELLGRASHSLWHHTKPDGSAYPEEECPIYATHRDGLVHRVSTEVFWSKDGTSFPVEYSSTPILEQGRLEGAVVAFVDITARKRAEEEKLSLERQVQQAQKLESLGVLAGGIAHDFNNILMAVQGHAELALDRIPPTSPACGHLAEITTATVRAADLCRQMLAYAGKASFALERVALRDLIEEMAELLKTSISEKVKLTLNLEEGLPPIQADPSQIRQIVMNLIINASEAIGDRDGTIAVSVGATRCDAECLKKTELHDDLPPGPYVRLEVADTGGGMDAETQARIFEPFFTTKFTGRGLGLAAVLGIVHVYKGALKVHSEHGKGTTFEVLFPALADGEDTARSVKASPMADWRGKGRILLVDDEESLLTLGARMLEHLGFNVVKASDGRQAVNLYREQGSGIDLVLMDLTMPHMGGAEAFDELRLLNPDVRVVLASGYARDDVSSSFRGRKPSGVIQKPYTLASLREALAGLQPERLHGGE